MGVYRVWGLDRQRDTRLVVSYLAVRHNEPLDSCRLWLDDTPTHRLRVDVTHNLQAASVATLSGGGMPNNNDISGLWHAFQYDLYQATVSLL